MNVEAVNISDFNPAPHLIHTIPIYFSKKVLNCVRIKIFSLFQPWKSILKLLILSRMSCNIDRVAHELFYLRNCNSSICNVYKSVVICKHKEIWLCRRYCLHNGEDLYMFLPSVVCILSSSRKPQKRAI